MLKHILPIALAVSLLGPAAAGAQPVSVTAYARNADIGRTFSVDGTPLRTFRATYVPAPAHGDLDGDGVLSTFEIEGEADANGARILPGMYVDREVE